MKKKILLLLSLWVAAAGLFAQTQTDGKPVAFRTQDGWEINGIFLAPQAGQKTALLLHDIGKNQEAYAAFSAKLKEAGFGYLALDLRGHGKSVNKGDYKAFAKEGVDNDYNKMTRDVNAAMDYLKGRGVAEENVVFIGAGLGANVAAKSASLWPGIAGLAMLTPLTNLRDVLPIPALRVYKGYTFIACAADDKKAFLEASLMRNVAFLSAGEGMVTFATAYDKESHEMLDRWLSAELLQWLKTPQKPELNPDISQEETPDPYGESYENVAPSATEEALVPSVLE
ncbi:MAG: alpha/beta fold hydrolase [Elusimicrobiaceae bacterium]|nr:alpha/beta fold hydrolase [Elusimicrobiaceae bacterium]